MAGAHRAAHDPLTLADAVAPEPWLWSFLQLLRTVECTYPDRPRLGESRRAAEDVLRLAQEPSLAFAPSAIDSFTARPDGTLRLAVLFFGLFGPAGPLPLHLTEYARQRKLQDHDPTFAHFADVFHHRALSLFYRAWAAAEPAVQYDRPASDGYALWLGSLLGYGLGTTRDADALPDSVRLHFAGHFASPTRTPDGLRAVIEGYFEVPASVEEFHGRWIELPERLLSRLGSPECRLGEGAALGDRVWDAQCAFRLRLGPTGLESFRRFLPGSDSVRRLESLVRSYVHDEFEWDACVVLAKEEVPGVRLGESGRLAWTSWLTSRAPESDAADYVYEPFRAPGPATATTGV